jgi:acyl transferase domain-containing protein
MNLAREIESEINIELYPTLFFEYENIEALIQYFISEHKEQFDKHLQPESVNVKVKLNISQVAETSFPTNINSHLASSNINSAFNQAEVTTPISADDSIPQKYVYLTEQANKEEQLHDIAVIGMSGKFPKSQNLQEFSEHLLKGTDLVEEIPLSHWDYKPWFEPNGKLESKIYTKWGSFITDVDKFDARFFNISEQEAKAMDPQIRLLLEVLYATADDAGYTSMIRGSETGIYVGSSFQDYAYCLLKAQNSSIAYSTVGNAITMLANRASFYFNLHGPSLTLDTACSSSLVALHLACQALKNGECKTAFVAGANLILSPYHYLTFCSLDALSATGRCHTFDASADGYIPAETIAAVLLKPLTKALEDGDQIHAVIKGSAVAHGGHASAITAPSVTQEKAVMLKAWANAKIDPRTINYMEAHGTGTKLGDPIEMEAVKKAFGEHTTDTGFCAIGSLKAHMGHAEPAAGIASLIKVILALKAKKIPMMPNFNTLNPYINLEKSPVYINKEVEEWKLSGNHPRRAGINAFGFGGTYAHAVIEEFSDPNAHIQNRVEPTTAMEKLILLSAQNEEALQNYAVNLKNNVLNKIGTLNNENEAKTLLKNIAYTLQIGRESMKCRAVFLVDSIHELVEKLGQFMEQNGENDGVLVGKPSEENLNLVFSGKAGEIYLKTILEEKDISALAQLWILGAQIDWRLLYSQYTRPNKISLPTYPFIKKRYWYASEASQSENHINNFVHNKENSLAEEYAKNAQINIENLVDAPVKPSLDVTNSVLAKPKKVSVKTIKKWLHEELKKLTQLEDEQIDPDRLFEAFGMNSIDIIALFGRLSQFVQWYIPAGAYQDARTINSLAKYALAAKHSTFQDQMGKVKDLVGQPS